MKKHVLDAVNLRDAKREKKQSAKPSALRRTNVRSRLYLPRVR